MTKVKMTPEVFSSETDEGVSRRMVCWAQNRSLYKHGAFQKRD